MKKKQTIDKRINEYASLNAKNMIDRIIKLIEYQENVSISYSCKKMEN